MSVQGKKVSKLMMQVLKYLSARAAVCRGQQLYGRFVLAHCFLK
ncbi:hypothetical protein GCWU000325_00787 [Alloprevotella tannerae ATCC 51259]|uniref:Uncharacterized protein n=1 Tax=Alloprevotella tannerae ATCC 51259 TaxID=626522 RepID=C9LF06_9BACT|nr:hypothetical protein GCWU000325_00787 [Alloprevotella tannerae ATCC 51259]